MANQCAKVSYPTKKAAQKDIEFQKSQHIRFSKREKNSKAGKKHYAYECPRCGMWHLTTLKQSRKY